MNLISKLPGPLLVFLGAFCLSFGGLIVKSFVRSHAVANIVFGDNYFLLF